MVRRLHTLIISTLVPLLLSGCTDTIVNHFAFFPMRFSAEDYSLAGSDVRDVAFTTEDGVRLHGFYVPNPKSKKLVLFFHGNAGHALHRLPAAKRLAETGVGVLLVGYRGYGRSEGKPSEPGIYADGKAALTYATEKLKFAPQNIFVFGRSLGSTVAIDLAQDRELGGLILISTFTSAHEVMASAGMGWLRWLVDRRPFDQAAKVERINLPALFIHGERDREVPYRLGAKLYQRYPSDFKSMLSVSGAGHNDLFAKHGEAIWLRVAAFIKAPEERAGQEERW
ncbi:alpha/beta hydrolase [Pontibacterium granulatum]|uniref:alpha/beta hydrolase n=1 Tax=Pontibacterium granulatum TaxID=2036029 RepID=UPI00249B7B23|nr:alpha/beta hydrolase [Pontibacterium granulatum]MDI3323731.1 alpha/beta hydrolase [Pontibacterium granulatum]